MEVGSVTFRRSLNAIRRAGVDDIECPRKVAEVGARIGRLTRRGALLSPRFARAAPIADAVIGFGLRLCLAIADDHGDGEVESRGRLALTGAVEGNEVPGGLLRNTGAQMDPER